MVTLTYNPTPNTINTYSITSVTATSWGPVNTTSTANYVQFSGRLVKNGKYNVHCSICGRWAKLVQRVPARVRCERCLGETAGLVP